MRDDRQMLVLNGIFVVGGLALLIDMNIGVAPDRRGVMLGASVALVALIAGIVWHQQRRRDALMIRPAEVVYTSGNKLRSVARADIRRVKVVLNMFGTDILLFGSDGGVVARLYLSQLRVKEVRAAFVEAGLSVDGESP